MRQMAVAVGCGRCGVGGWLGGGGEVGRWWAGGGQSGQQ